MSVLSVGQTDIGRKRKTNQDSIYLCPQKNIFFVADGMGGHQGGDVASAMAVQSVAQYFENPIETEPISSLRKALEVTNAAILERANQEPQLKGMGTTGVMLHFRDTHAYIANVGDSRAYLLNHSKIYQLSRDHSVIQEKLYLGLYTREQAQQDSQKNALARSIGFETEILIDVFSYKVARNDIFLLCSDGLHGLVTDQNILEVINYYIDDPSRCQQHQLEQAVSSLIGLANANGGRDNISAILVVAQ